MSSPRIVPDWVTLDRQRARLAAHRAAQSDRRGHALHQLAAVYVDRGARRVTSGMPDHELRDLAERRADVMRDRLADMPAMDADALRGWINDQTGPLDARPFPEFTAAGGPLADQRAGMLARVVCPLWWRRQLRRACVVLRETEAMHAGEVCRRKRQPYCTTDTVRRRAERQASNAAMLEATEIEDAEGEIITLAQAVAASTANKAIRRGELMTRIRGCEEWATAAGMVGVFTTNTCPSRFHPQTMWRGANPKHDGSTPRQGQQWLCATWARARAALQRARVRVFGFRVAEPHHDGCPHWHMLLWVDPAQLDAMRATLRRYWLADDGDEAGAAEHRFKAVDIDPARGGAVGYVSKYIAKNIDDAGSIAGAHADDGGEAEQGELFGATAQRVEAWAAAWGIRQFQAIGQPPVTVWRELRRVDQAAAAGGSDAIRRAHAAVNRSDRGRACWRSYLDAQGGAMTGRGYRIRIAADIENREGRYGPRDVTLPRGVEDARRPGEWILSNRREWKPRGAWTEGDRRTPCNPLREVVRPEAAQPLSGPRTRVNNCTDWRPMRALLAELRRSRDFESWAGGPLEELKCPAPPPKSRPT